MSTKKDKFKLEARPVPKPKKRKASPAKEEVALPEVTCISPEMIEDAPAWVQTREGRLYWASPDSYLLYAYEGQSDIVVETKWFWLQEQTRELRPDGQVEVTRKKAPHRGWDAEGRQTLEHYRAATAWVNPEPGHPDFDPALVRDVSRLPTKKPEREALVRRRLDRPKARSGFTPVSTIVSREQVERMISNFHNQNPKGQ